MSKKSIKSILADEWYKAKVIKGSGRGRKLGFPTINLTLPRSWEQKHGVYVCLVKIKDNQSQTKVCYYKKSIHYYKGLLHYGPRLTFKETEPSLEIYITPPRSEQVTSRGWGRITPPRWHKVTPRGWFIKEKTEVEFKLLKYLRKTKKFKDKTSLINQIRRDVKESQTP